ncbi:MAG: enolase C-terminal domain-like protein [archaeon]
MKETIITDIKVRKVLNSKADWTIEVEISTAKGRGIGSCPLGTSTGEHEVKPFSKNIDETIRKGNELIGKLFGHDLENIAEFDKIIKEIDGTENFSNIGGALSTALSISAAKAGANSLGIPLFRHLGPGKKLPFLLSKVIGGGKHAKGPTFQEFLIMATEKEFEKNLELNLEIFKEIGEILDKKDKNFMRAKDLEGAWVTSLNEEKCVKLIDDLLTSKYKNKEIVLGIDFAASNYYSNGKYVVNGKRMKIDEYEEYLASYVKKYGVTYLEDPFDQNDFDAHKRLIGRFKKIVLCGDDLFCTNKDRLQKGIESKAANSIIIKPNQVGTVSGAMEVVEMAKKNHYLPVLSHRSGETEDNFLAHFAVGCEIPILKISLSGGERIAKINELLRINEYLKKEGV